MNEQATPIVDPSRLILNVKDRQRAVIDLLSSTRNHLMISIFRCDDFRILQEILEAVRRRVRVEILISRRARGWKTRLEGLAGLLQSVGAEVYRYDGPFSKYHAKYVVADDNTALVSSLNFTYKCFESTCDFLLWTHDPFVVRGLSDLFQHDCHTPALPTAPVADRLIVGPEKTRERLSQLLKSARTSIAIVDHRVTDPEMIALLEERKRSGVNVRIFGRGDVNGMVSHGRLILVDGQHAVIGSVALSQPSLDLRREVAITIEEPEFLQQLTQFVEDCAKPGAKDLPRSVDDEEEENGEDGDEED